MQSQHSDWSQIWKLNDWLESTPSSAEKVNDSPTGWVQPLQHLITENVIVAPIATGALNIILKFKRVVGLHNSEVSIVTLPTLIAFEPPKRSPSASIGSGPAAPLPHFNKALPGSGEHLVRFFTTQHSS